MRKLSLILIVVTVSVVAITGTGIGIWLGIKNQNMLPHPESEWSFKISGNIIGDDFNITIAELLAMPRHKDNYVIRGSSTFEAEFDGVLLSYLFENAINVNLSATTVTFVAVDEYSLNFNINDLLSKDSAILAYKMDGQYLNSKEDGGPGYLRLIFPPENEQDYNGPLCLKWIVEIIFT
ncbi:MAG: molybdopterin-dependent oxidoreductase [Candidatus Heimdallarchaeota archaeon]|nr:molybdopterin-dependent oxidoreductase [Candidatus Heimdallarchaeota archaeon]